MENQKIYKNVKLGDNCQIGNYVIIGLPPKGKDNGELETIIGDNAVIRDHTIIYAGNKIGNNFQTGHHVVIRESNIIGNDVSIGTFGEFAFNIKIGNNVKFHSGCHVYEYTIIETGARFNPGVYILNTKYPYRPNKDPEISNVLVKENARISAKCILMPGVIIGKWSLVGAGSLVTKNVEDYALVYGRPAKVKGDIRNIKDENNNQVYDVD